MHTSLRIHNNTQESYHTSHHILRSERNLSCLFIHDIIKTFHTSRAFRRFSARFHFPKMGTYFKSEFHRQKLSACLSARGREKNAGKVRKIEEKCENPRRESAAFSARWIWTILIWRLLKIAEKPLHVILIIFQMLNVSNI